MKVLISGGASYIGAWLIPLILGDGHLVTVYDSMLFGNGCLPDNDNCRAIKADVRDEKAWRDACKGQDAVIYLASISRELMCQENEKLAYEVNVESFRPAVITAKEALVRRFIYGSSVAVYGSSDHDAMEDEPLAPSTIYGRGKAACEAILAEYQDDGFCCTVTRSASVCGYSPRQRFDLTINKMVHDAVRLRKIKVSGGAQKRSHISIKDITRFYRFLLDVAPSRIAGQAFNVVTENQSVKESAMMVARIVGNTNIEVGPRTDDRSYSVDGGKALRVLGFKPAHLIEDAVNDLKVRLEAGYWKDSMTNPVYQNLADVA